MTRNHAGLQQPTKPIAKHVRLPRSLTEAQAIESSHHHVGAGMDFLQDHFAHAPDTHSHFANLNLHVTLVQGVLGLLGHAGSVSDDFIFDASENCMREGWKLTQHDPADPALRTKLRILTALPTYGLV